MSLTPQHILHGMGNTKKKLIIMIKVIQKFLLTSVCWTAQHSEHLYVQATSEGGQRQNSICPPILSFQPHSSRTRAQNWLICYYCNFTINFCSPELKETIMETSVYTKILLYPARHQQEGFPPIWAWTCSRFLPVSREVLLAWRSSSRFL